MYSNFANSNYVDGCQISTVMARGKCRAITYVKMKENKIFTMRPSPIIKKKDFLLDFWLKNAHFCEFYSKYARNGICFELCIKSIKFRVERF